MTKKQTRILLWVVVCTALLLAITLTLFSWSTNYNYCVRNNGSHYSGQYGDNDQPVIVPAFAEKLGGFRLFVHCGGIFTEQHSGAITAAATILLLAVTALLSWIAYMQFTTSRAQLRAYVMHHTTTLVDGSKFKKKTFVNRDGQPGVIVAVKNLGQTPSYFTRHWCAIEVAPIADEQKMIGPTDLSDLDCAALGPGGEMTANRWLNRSITKEEHDGIKKGTHAIFVFGRVTYRDAFGDIYWTTYRMRYTDSAWPPLADTAPMSFCLNGNDAD